MNRYRTVIVVATVLVALLVSTTGQATTRPRSFGETQVSDAAQRLAAGIRHTCQINDDGTVRCWGENEHGQLGNRSTVDSLVPVAVAGLGNAVAIAAGRFHTCALLANGSARCWGDNSAGQLGDGSRTNQLSPVTLVTGLDSAVALVAGDFHNCALLADGRARCWGWNDNGRLGDGTTVDRSTPAAVSGIGNAVAIAAGTAHNCVLLADGRARCWGYNATGQLGEGPLGADRLTSVSVDGLTNAVGITAGFGHTCALLANGTGRCWGDNFSGQLGTASTNAASIFITPVAVSGLANATSISAGRNHTCAVLADGSARCWGFNLNRQLGDGTSATTQRFPVTVRELGDAVVIAAGAAHSCALIANGATRCWGNGTAERVALLPGGSGFAARAVAAGRFHSCALRANGQVSCWGLNSAGQLGNGTNVNQLVPVTVLNNAVAVAAGNSHTCALLANGTARCWGENSVGQVGDGSAIKRLAPVPVSGLTNAVAIALGDEHACALLANGSEFCWGLNTLGQLGVGGGALRLSPALVADSNAGTTSAIAAGGLHSCALLASPALLDSKAICWGAGTNGQLGNGGLSNHSTANSTAVGLLNAVAVAAGGTHSCALLVDGTGRCWGNNSAGAMGNGNTLQQVTPTFVGGLSNAVSVAAGGSHSCSVIADGTARCWGDNSAGQLGDGTLTQRLAPITPTIPVQVRSAVRGGDTIVTLTFPPLGSVVQVANGGTHSCAAIANGAVRCWGANDVGQLGIDSTARQLRPTLLPSFTLNIDPLVQLPRSPRVAIAQIVAVCDRGQRLHVSVDIAQGPVSGHGVGEGKCTGAFERYPVTVAARGRHGYNDGAAEVSATALIRQAGRTVDTQAWSRTVTVERQH
ncbi:MAG: RCC1 repeat-containing protein [Gammaproteobacteria bacterium]|nr:RCC1 repeat-containing protein [Gammaproteobacteria bacterium]